jgi:hypothetical protein
MLFAKQSNYVVVTNKYVPTFEEANRYGNKYPDQEVFGCEIVLPDWFAFSKGRRFIKFYGSNIILNKRNVVRTWTQKAPGGDWFWTYYTDENIYENVLHMTIHSDVAKFTNGGYTKVDIKEGLEKVIPEKETSYEDYVMVANNFFIPKTYEILDPNQKTVKISFLDSHGRQQRVFYLRDFMGAEDMDGDGHVESTHSFNMEALMFKIECELIVI